LKRSKCVPLVLLGTLAGIAGCDGGGTQELRQESYASLEDCHKDWGNDPRDCTRAQNSSSSSGSSGGYHGGSGGYFGPRYYWDRSSGHPVAVSSTGETRALTNSFHSRGVPSSARSVSVSSVSRGGFGSSARGFSGGG